MPWSWAWSWAWAALRGGRQERAVGALLACVPCLGCAEAPLRVQAFGSHRPACTQRRQPAFKRSQGRAEACPGGWQRGGEAGTPPSTRRRSAPPLPSSRAPARSAPALLTRTSDSWRSMCWRRQTQAGQLQRLSSGGSRDRQPLLSALAAGCLPGLLVTLCTLAVPAIAPLTGRPFCLPALFGTCWACLSITLRQLRSAPCAVPARYLYRSSGAEVLAGAAAASLCLARGLAYYRHDVLL